MERYAFPFTLGAGESARKYRVHQVTDEVATVEREASPGVERRKKLVTVRKHPDAPWPQREELKTFTRKVEKADRFGLLGMKSRGVFTWHLLDAPFKASRYEDSPPLA